MHGELIITEEVWHGEYFNRLRRAIKYLDRKAEQRRKKVIIRELILLMVLIFICGLQAGCASSIPKHDFCAGLARDINLSNEEAHVLALHDQIPEARQVMLRSGIYLAIHEKYCQ